MNCFAALVLLLPLLYAGSVFTEVEKQSKSWLQFQAWAARHKKTYSSANEQHRHFTIWMANHGAFLYLLFPKKIGFKKCLGDSSK
jgi:hypothetical protein